jgi:hypothetical protein
MVDANIYGWTYDNFNTNFGWDVGTQLKYEAWENIWSRKIDAYIYTDSAACPRLTDAYEKLEVGDIVNEMMTQMNVYLKAETVESPLETGFYESVGFPAFKGDPEANKGKGTGHYLVLNKLRRKHSESEVRVDSIRHGIIPDDNPFKSEGVRY